MQNKGLINEQSSTYPKNVKKNKNSTSRMVKRFSIIVVSIVFIFIVVAVVFVYGITRDDTKIDKTDDNTGENGQTTVDGDEAEQLVRFRKGYSSQDLMRIEVQQKFMKAIVEQILSKETLLNNIAPLTQTLLNCVETDISVMDALKYAKHINDINSDNIKMATMLGEGSNYFVYDKIATEALVQEMFFDKVVDVKIEDESLKEPSLENKKIRCRYNE